MPALRPEQIVHAIIGALDESSASAVLLSEAMGNPRRFLVQYGRRTFELWTYIWTLTHGGGFARPEAEYRIQITGVDTPIETNEHGPTLLLGLEPDTQCFAGFDLSKHRTFSQKSPSIQIPITALYDALQNGISFARKSNDEIAIGVRPDLFLAYCLDADALHREGADLEITALLTEAANLENIEPDSLVSLPEERERIVREVSILSRDSSFRRKVVNAYEARCAVTRMQLRLIDAAHILPVGVDGSSDDVSNGICLSPTYHRAFDNGLIYLDDSLHMQMNIEQEKRLTADGLIGGVAHFKSFLGKRIHLPQDRSQWPSLEMIEQANSLRRIKV
jgi:putative restriction endonuclease